MAPIGYAINLTVELREPLNGRQVIDGSLGERVPRCRAVQACMERGVRESEGPVILRVQAILGEADPSGGYAVQAFAASQRPAARAARPGHQVTSSFNAAPLMAMNAGLLVAKPHLLAI